MTIERSRWPWRLALLSLGLLSVAAPAAMAQNANDVRNAIPGECGVFWDSALGEDEPLLQGDDPTWGSGFDTLWNLYKPEQALLISDVGVVNDSKRTYDACKDASGTKVEYLPQDTSLYSNGVISSTTYARPPLWSFGYLMGQLAQQAGKTTDPQNNNAIVATFIDAFFQQWKTANPNADSCTDADARAGIYNKIIGTTTAPGVWPRTSTGELDVKRAPFRLLAIVNRMDLAIANYSGSTLPSPNVGEGRLVFGLYDPNTSCTDSTNQKLSFTLIFEYKLPCYLKNTSCNMNVSNDVEYWTQKWVGLAQAATPYSGAYNDSLASMTRNFSSYYTATQTGNPFLGYTTVRTNEKLSGSPSWQQREFKLSSGKLKLSPVANTPKASYNNTDTLGSLLNTNASTIYRGTYKLSSSYQGCVATAEAGTTAIVWQSSAAVSVEKELRHDFAVNTCNGCHGMETSAGPSHLHIAPRKRTESAALSAFLSGGAQRDLDSYDWNEFQDPLGGPTYFHQEVDCRMMKFDSLVKMFNPAYRQYSPENPEGLPAWLTRPSTRSH